MSDYYGSYTPDGEPVSILDGLPRAASSLARIKVSDGAVMDRLDTSCARSEFNAHKTVTTVLKFKGRARPRGLIALDPT